MAVTYSRSRQSGHGFKPESSDLLEEKTSTLRTTQSSKEEIRILNPQESEVVGQRTAQSWTIRAVNVMQPLKQSLCSTKMKGTVYPVLGCGIVTGVIVYLALSYAPKTSHLEEPPKVILSLCSSVAAGMVTLLGIKCRPCITHLMNTCGQLCTRESSVHEGSHGQEASEANDDDASLEALSPEEQDQQPEEAGASTLEEQALFAQGENDFLEFVRKTGLNETELCGENALDYYDVLNFHAGKTLRVNNLEEMSESAKTLHENIPALGISKDTCRWVSAIIQVSKEVERDEGRESPESILLG